MPKTKERKIRITEDNWLVFTIEFLEELRNDLYSLDDHERSEEVERLIKYLNKTN